MSAPSFGLTEADFLSKYRIDSTTFARCGIKWDELVAIAQHHCENYVVLMPVANYATERLRQLSDVHTLRLRIKDPEHLIEKIIRKNPDRSVPICRDNYENEVTDLIGIRALHLFKDQWKPIHDFVLNDWDTHEQPTAYVRAGDSPKFVEQLKESGCKVEEHAYGYRSVHYVIKASPGKRVHLIELQVRTVFEEGWSEIDHLVRYPNHSKEPLLKEFLVLFNTLAGNADEMGSYIKNLHLSLQHDAVKVEQLSHELKTKEADLAKTSEELKKAVASLNISENEKGDLQKQISKLTAKEHATIVMRQRPLDFMTIISSYGASSVIGIAASKDWPDMKDFKEGKGDETTFCTKCGTLFHDDSPTSFAPLSEERTPKACPTCRAKK